MMKYFATLFTVTAILGLVLGFALQLESIAALSTPKVFVAHTRHGHRRAHKPAPIDAGAGVPFMLPLPEPSTPEFLEASEAPSSEGTSDTLPSVMVREENGDVTELEPSAPEVAP